jgi:CHAT domain-containing protein
VDPLNNLAGIYYDEKEYAKAEPLLRRCLEIAQKSTGLESPRTANALNNLAEFYQDTGNFPKAEDLLLQSLRIYKNTLRDRHPDTSVVLFNLAGLYCRKNDFAKAEPLYKQALQIQENARGEYYPNESSDCRFLETLLIDLGKKDEAWSYESKAATAEQRQMNNVFSFTTERQRLVYLNGRSPFDIPAFFGNAPSLAEALFRHKGVVLDSILEDGKAAETSQNPEIKRIRDALQMAGCRLMKMQTELPGEISDTEIRRHRDAVTKLQTEVDQLQKELAQNAAELGTVRRALRLTVSEVQTALPDNVQLLEFIRYSHYLGTNHWESRYGVVLISQTNEPVWVALGSATNIDQMLRKYEEVMRGQERGDASILKTLYAEVIDPVVNKLPANVNTLIISPDAELNFLSFATLVDSQDRFLAERYRIKYVASGRDLVYGRMVTNANPELAVFANPEFDQAPGATPLPHTNTVNLAMLGTDQRDYNGYSLASLPNTEQEARFLSSKSSDWHLKPSIFTGSAATEAQVKALHSPYILHLATHGFFLPDTEPTNQPPHLSLDRKLPVVLHNPMQRSGLALAGAQVTLEAWKRGEVPDPDNDGILMAQEVGLLDLQNTWLVTLSACDTGIGEARAGEGVMGLRRGFIQAGAQNLLMTLWPVSDKWTADLMAAFYDRAMKTRNAPDALAEVQREYLIKLKQEKNPVMAARLAGPFVMNFQGRPGNN